MAIKLNRPIFINLLLKLLLICIIYVNYLSGVKANIKNKAPILIENKNNLTLILKGNENVLINFFA